MVSNTTVGDKDPEDSGTNPHEGSDAKTDKESDVVKVVGFMEGALVFFGGLGQWSSSSAGGSCLNIGKGQGRKWICTFGFGWTLGAQ